MVAGRRDGSARGRMTVKRVPRRTAVDEDESAMRLDGAMHDGEAEAAAARLRREEGIEQPVADLDRDAGPRVADAQRDARRARTRVRRRACSRGAAPTSTRTSPLCRRGLDGVEQQVEDGAVQQVLVAFDDELVPLGVADDAHASSRSGCRSRASRAAPRASDREVERLRARRRARARSRETRRAAATGDRTRA